MDTNTINHVSLCSGYGGIDLGLKRAIGERLRTVAFVEVECFAVCNLAAKAEAKLLDNAPIWSDLRTFPWGKFHGLVDILSGGYPCQPFSAAGKRLGAEDPRHLWPHISAGIAAMRPSVCFFENVEGHISLGLPDVLQDLAGMGYRTTWGIFSASEVGAPHQRKRVFILAHAQQPTDRSQTAWHEIIRTHAGRSASWSGGSSGELADSLRQRGASGLSRSLAGHEGFAGIADDCGGEGCGELGDTSSARHAGTAWSGGECAQGQSIGYVAQSNGGVWPSRPGEQQYEWEPPRVVVDDTKGVRSAEPADGRGQAAPWADAPSEASMGNAASERPQERSPRSDHSSIQATECGGRSEGDRQAQPSMGLLSHGTSGGICGPNVSGLSDQELAEIRQWMVTSTNRTDSLRLLGNGVVPATAERAFRVLVSELMEEQR